MLPKYQAKSKKGKHAIIAGVNGKKYENKKEERITNKIIILIKIKVTYKNLKSILITLFFFKISFKFLLNFNLHKI